MMNLTVADDNNNKKQVVEMLITDMANININNDYVDNEQTSPLCTMPDLSFINIVKYLDLSTYLKLQSTCMRLEERCMNIPPVVIYDAISVQLLQKPQKPGSILPMANECGDKELQIMLDYLKYNKPEAKELCVREFTCSKEMFVTAIETWNISEISCNNIPHELVRDPIMKKITTLSIDLGDAYLPQLYLENSFVDLEIDHKIRIDTVQKVLEQLIEGERVLNMWTIHNVHWTEDAWEDIFDGWKVVPQSEVHLYKTKPLVAKDDDDDKYPDYNVICKDGKIYEVTYCQDLRIARITPPRG